MVFDKAYVDFADLSDLDARGVQWDTRAKDNMNYRVVKTLTQGKQDILRDQVIALAGAKNKGMRMRRVEVRVEMNGEWLVMVFITSHHAFTTGTGHGLFVAAACFGLILVASRI